LATESELEASIGVEYLYPIVIRIGYIDITTSTDGDTVGASELTVPRTEATESGLEDTTRVEYLYAMVATISHIDITTATDSDTAGAIELTVPRTVATESEGKSGCGCSGTGGDTNTSDRSGRD
jgi:hypothetical protein